MMSYLETNKIRRCRPMMGTLVEIAVDGCDEYHAHQAINAAFAEIGRIEKLMSFYDAMSEISILNRLAAGERIRVSIETYQVLKHALELHEMTQGIFDIAIGSELVNRGILPANDFSNEYREGTSKDIELEPDGRVRCLKPTCLDSGGIAKGFAVDQAIKALQEHGVPNGLVNAGGDMRVMGDEKQEVWIRHASTLNETMDYPIWLQNAAIATSSTRINDQHAHLSPALHIQMPLKKIVNEEKTVSVIAAQCVWADALTKVVLLADHRMAKKCLAFYQAKARVWDGEGRLIQEIN